MKRTAVDTNVIIAALSSWHERHDAAHSALDTLLRSGKLVLVAHCLVETYSVLTRLPAPHRIASVDAAAALLTTFKQQKLHAWPAKSFWPTLSAWAEQSVAGGRVYDALIALAAKEGGAEQILTLNPKHFTAIASGLEVISID